MTTRNFDSRVVTDRLQARQHARSVYDARARGRTIIANPQNSNPNASGMIWYQEGTPTLYDKGLLGGTYTVQSGAIFGIPLFIEPPITTSAPSAPTIDSITAANQQLSVFFTPSSDGGSPITNYSVSLDGGATFTPVSPSQTTSPILLTGLTNGTTYSIVIRALNAVGASSDSNAVSGTPAAIPDAPTLQAILPADSSAYVYFRAGANGGSPITNYEWTLDSGSTWAAISPVDTATPIQVTGLTNGVATTVQLRAINASGPSAASNSLTTTPQVGVVATGALYYDPNDPSSYSGSGSTVSNLGTAGVFQGTKSGGVLYQTGTGIARSIFRFSGTDHITYGQYNLGSTFTITAWIYPRSKVSINGLFANAGANQAPLGFKVGWNNWMANNQTMLYEGGNGSAGSAQATVNNAVVYDQWQHVAYLLDTVQQLVFFVRNGVPVDTASYSTNQIVAGIGTNNPAFRIGTFTDGSYGMNAELGYFKVYSGLRTVSDLDVEYNATKASFGL
jgi:hypothetical protein